MELDEAIYSNQGLRLFAGFPVAIGGIDLRLLRIRAKGEARLELFKIRSAFCKVIVFEFFSSFAVQLGLRPAIGLVFIAIACATANK